MCTRLSAPSDQRHVPPSMTADADRVMAAQGGRNEEVAGSRRYATHIPEERDGRWRSTGSKPVGAGRAGSGDRADQDWPPQLVYRRHRLRGRGDLQRHGAVFRQHQLDRGGPQDRDHQGRRPVQSAGRFAEGEEADRKRQGRSDRRRASEQRRARRAQLHEAAEGVLCGHRRRYRRHHLGSLSVSVPDLDLGVPAQHADGELRLRQSRQGDRDLARPTMPAAATSSRSSTDHSPSAAARC